MIKIKSGFTLIELLVVIAIIAIITSIGVANLITAQNSSYPFTTPGSAFESGAVPTDPKNSGIYTINWNVTSDTYCVCATMEMVSGNSANTACTSWSDPSTYYCAKNRQ